MFRDEIEDLLRLLGLHVVDVEGDHPYVTVRYTGSSNRDVRYGKATVWVAVAPDDRLLERLAVFAWQALYDSSVALPQSREFDGRSLTPGALSLSDVIRFDVFRA